MTNNGGSSEDRSSPTRPGFGTTHSGFIDRWIFVFMAGLFVVTALAGFVPYSIVKINAVVAGERPPFPIMMHVHAVLMGSWLMLLLAQTTLMATGRRAFHKQLGMVSLVLAPAIVITVIILVPTWNSLIWSSFEFMEPAAIERQKINLTGTLLEQIRMGIMFSVFVGWALLVRRRDPGLHKRFMILATVYPLLAGISRAVITWLPSAVYFDWPTFYDVSLLVWIMPMFLWDFVRTRRVHKAYIIWIAVGIPFAIPIHLLWGTPWWIQTAETMLGLGG